MVVLRNDIGGWWAIDAQDYILNDASPDKIVPPYRAQVLAMLHDFGGWIIAACDVWLDQHNPSRELALPLNATPTNS